MPAHARCENASRFKSGERPAQSRCNDQIIASLPPAVLAAPNE